MFGGIIHPRSNPDQQHAGKDCNRTGDHEQPAESMAPVPHREAEARDQHAAVDQDPDQHFDAGGRQAQNESSAIARQVSSRVSTTANQATIFGSS